MRKTIIVKIGQKEEDFLVFKNGYDIYDTYNDYLGDYLYCEEGGEIIYDEDELETVEIIREYHDEVFKRIPSGTYDIKDFERLALELLSSVTFV